MVKINRAAEYAENQFKTAGKLKSIQMLHEGAIRFLKEALENQKDRKKNCTKTQNILAQLQLVVRVNEGETAEALFYLYDYIYSLIEIGTSIALKNALDLLEHLSTTFRLVGRT